MFQGVSILGSTGSIGCNALRVIEALSERFRVMALAAGRNMEKLAGQIQQFSPHLVSVETDECAFQLAALLRERNVKAPEIYVGEYGLIKVATHHNANIVVSSIVGAVGLVPTLRALEQGKRVALANKETLVMAGELMTQTARKSGAEIMPVDSEHNALHQILRGEKIAEVKRLILTASGGPFRCASREEMNRASVSDAMNHPTWQMGAKITIDSATLMNKGLEVIEARWLFDVPAEKIDALVHPESVVHSMIEMIDNSVIAQLGATDMRHAIQYALTYPQRVASNVPPLDLTLFAGLHFEAPDTKRFPCLRLAYQALEAGGTMTAAMNAANECAVAAFLDGRIRLTAIAETVEAVMNETKAEAAETLEIILRADARARANANHLIAHHTQQVAGKKA